jgi:hypothetical protein
MEPLGRSAGQSIGRDGLIELAPVPRARLGLTGTVNFGPFISYTNIDSESLNILRESINDIMK